mgnify:CR=1 FL=1
MFLELLIGYWVLKPIAQEIDKYSYEQELLQYEIEDLKKEIRTLKKRSSETK